jgi:hypothetical protein
VEHDLDWTARALGVAGILERQKERNREKRKAFREGRQKWKQLED